ncbi:MAG: hypothetical protein QM619_13725 [Micropruina sp.]|uniref:hypothetical protein n=1 Tax=Micropruina sp. TaxID=2737536 RepID=UPI0039E55E8C
MGKTTKALHRGVAGFAVLLATGAAALATATPAEAAYGRITVSFGDWRCAATGGGSVVAVQMGSQYGSAPYTRGRQISINARTGTTNNLTGVIWCKRPWWRFGVTTPVYNIHQGLWVSYVGQRFNV